MTFQARTEDGPFLDYFQDKNSKNALSRVYSDTNKEGAKDKWGKCGNLPFLQENVTGTTELQSLLHHS